ncbi:MAG: gamma-glutamyl-gamma-aminobutyrate hydrolase family protein [Spirochaeta sp.]|jgi:putative glutamine amidotransferase|nr:gamma-glutamyl-gamma-aminobutyrate hydrolase family protein [Spirochaeta sp.]
MSSTTRRPRIGITLFSGREGPKFYTKVQYNYVQSALDAGGTPVLIPTVTDTARAADFVDTIDALMLTGGEDISPLVYGAQPRPELGMTNLTRDRWEIALLRVAEAKRIPILGICRGIQVMAVSRDGDLYQDIQAETESLIGHMPFQNPMESLHHTITIDADSLLSKIFKEEQLIVNSFHHQALKTPGTGLTVTSRAPDGIIEAVEDTTYPFYLGVQFHAEALPPVDTAYLAIFTALIEAAGA